MSNLVKVFNDHLVEFLDDVIRIFPDNADLQTGRTFIVGLKKVNPRKIIEVWKNFVNDLYLEEINKGNLEFFIEKDYTHDVRYMSPNILQIIENIKLPLKQTQNENKKKTIKYVQNLCKICDLYYKTKK